MRAARLTLPLFVMCVLGLLTSAQPAAAQHRSGRGGTSSVPIGPPIPFIPQLSYEGNVRELSSGNLTLQLDDATVVKVNITGKTDFYKDAKKVKQSTLAVGDRASLTAGEDAHGFLVATKVTYQRAANEEETARVQAPVPEPPPSAANQSNSLNDNSSSSDSGRPTLRRRNNNENQGGDSGDSGSQGDSSSGKDGEK